MEYSIGYGDTISGPPSMQIRSHLDPNSFSSQSHPLMEKGLIRSIPSSKRKYPSLWLFFDPTGKCCWNRGKQSILSIWDVKFSSFFFIILLYGGLSLNAPIIISNSGIIHRGKSNAIAFGTQAVGKANKGWQISALGTYNTKHPYEFYSFYKVSFHIKDIFGSTEHLFLLL